MQAISREAVREKSIRKGHISALHLWWGRRPLVAARAAVYAALVPAPTSATERVQYAQELSDLCKWNISSKALATAKAKILDNHHTQPKILDMFAGGGAIPLEAARLGCQVYAVDLNPVAHLIELCTFDFPQRFAGLNAEVERWGRLMLERIRAELSEWYPPIPNPNTTNATVIQQQWLDTPPPDTLTPIAYLWTRTIRCPNPSCGATVPLVRQTWLAQRRGRYIALKPKLDPQTQQVRFPVCSATTEHDLGFDPSSWSRSGNSACAVCGSTVSNDCVKAEGKAGRIGVVPMAIVCTQPGKHGKLYLSVSEIDPLLLPNDSAIRSRIEELCQETGLTVPDEPIFSGDSRAFFTHLYGLETFGQLFTPRQLLVLLTFAKHTRRIYPEIVQETGRTDFAQAITTYLALLGSRLADWNSTLCNWISKGEKVSDTYSRQALPMVWDFVEINPLEKVSGNANDALSRINETLETLSAIHREILTPPVIRRGSAHQLSSQIQEQIDAIITDPPYYDNIPYADLSDFFYVWLKRSIGHLYPEHFGGELTPKRFEAIAAPARFNGDKEAARHFYEQIMTQCFQQAHTVLKPDAPFVVIYAHKTTAGWATLVEALRSTGFMVTEAWPMDTERRGRPRDIDSAALESSIFLITRKLDVQRTGSYTRDVLPQLNAIIRERIETLRAINVSGADLIIAVLGAALRAYTQFSRVEHPNGEELPPNQFLEHVQSKVMEAVLALVMGFDQHGIEAIDAISKYYIYCRFQYGTSPIDFDEANVLARGLGVELDGPRSITSGTNPIIEKNKKVITLRDYQARGSDPELGLHDYGQASLVDILHRLLWLNDYQPPAIQQFLADARPDVMRLRLVGEALSGKSLATEPTLGAARDERTEEQKAIGRLLPVWKRVVEDADTGHGETIQISFRED